MSAANAAVLKEKVEARQEAARAESVVVKARRDWLQENLTLLFAEMDFEAVTHCKQVLGGHDKNITVLLFSPVEFEDYKPLSQPHDSHQLAKHLEISAFFAKRSAPPLTSAAAKGWRLTKCVRDGVPILIARAEWVEA